MILRAAFERDLEFARQRRAERMPKQVSRERLCIGRHIEQFVTRHAGIRARHDVPDRVAAGFARGQTRVGEMPHRQLDVVQPHEVKLHVLPGRDVPEAPGIPLGNIRQRIQLFAIQYALGNLHPKHLRIFSLALAIGATNEPEPAPRFGIDFATLEAAEGLDKLVRSRRVQQTKAALARRSGDRLGQT
jgi:hypothetical protein